MKLPALVIGVLLLTSPLIASKSTAPSQVQPPTGLTLEEKVILLEEFERQQRDFNAEQDSRLNRYTEVFLSKNAEQDERIKTLQERESVVSAYLALFASIVGLSMPVLLWIANNRVQAEKDRHAAAVKRDERLQGILKDFDVRFRKMEKHLFFISGKESGDAYIPIPDVGEEPEPLFGSAPGDSLGGA